MPHKAPEARKAYAREYMRRRRAAARTAKARAKIASMPMPTDPAAALARWSRQVLKVPPGHPLAGGAMALPDYGVDFLRDALSHRESLLCLGRKNAKSAVIAVFLLGRLVGPIRTDGWRGGVVSVSKEKAGELKRQMEEIAVASKLGGLRFLRSPAPGRVESATGTLDILSADRSAGHASGFDESVIDELGLLKERDRELVNGMRSAVSARDGRFVALSIMGDAPFTREMVSRWRGGDPGIAVHLYQAPEDCDLDDPADWAAANPGLAVGIKSIDYMRDEARRVIATPSDAPSFRAYDLNLPQDPSREMVLAPADLRACFVDDLPPREGPCVLGIDAGEATSATACVAVFPANGRTECWMGFGDSPPISQRARRDDAPYVQMVERGELLLYSGRVTPISQFMTDVATDLEGTRVIAAAADGYKDNEIRDWLDRAGVGWPISFRRVGAGKDGSADVRRFQRLVLEKRLRMREALALVSAISKSQLRRDENGNPAISRANSQGRIDMLSAAVIAAGLAEPRFDRPVRPMQIKMHVVR